MKKTIQTIATATLCLFLSTGVPAQTTALKVGDKVPDITINNIINYKATSAKLSDFKGKLLILDFWATWCWGCLKNFSMLDSLQAKYPNELQVLLVNDVNTGDTDEEVRNLFEKKKQLNGKAYTLPYINNDNQLTRLFPHKMIPHYVWIGADGRVKANTSAFEVNSENIERMISNKPTIMVDKADFDTSKALFLSERTPPGGLIQYSVFIKGMLEGLAAGNIYRKDGKVVYGRALTNSTLYGMYKSMSTAMMNPYNKRLMLIEVSEPERFVPKKADLKNYAWIKENYHTLEVVVPVAQSETLYPFMLAQLNAFSGYQGAIETRKSKCLILTITAGKTPVKSNGGKPQLISFETGVLKMVNQPLSSLVNSLNNAEGIPLRLVDESGFTANTDIAMSGSVELDVLQRELRAQGLELTEGERDLTFFVVKDQPKISINKTDKP